jgi:hypothetical protein
MRSRIRLLILLPVLTLSWPPNVASQDRGDRPRADEKTASVKVLISAEDKPAIPSGSKIEWESTGDGCKSVTGELNLRPSEATPLTLPVCKVKLTIFITGFSTKAVTVDLVGNEKKYADPIHIIVKLQGPAEVTWTHSAD